MHFLLRSFSLTVVPFSVQIGVYTSMCTRVVCALHNCIQNNMEQKEKGICIGELKGEQLIDNGNALKGDGEALKGDGNTLLFHFFCRCPSCVFVALLV